MTVKAGNKVMQDSGAMRHDQAGKGRYDLISVPALHRLAQHYENGITEGGYAERNWEKGVKVSRCINSAIRHANQYLDGKQDEDHLMAAVWNLFAIAHFEDRLPEMCDLPWQQTRTNPCACGDVTCTMPPPPALWID